MYLSIQRMHDTQRLREMLADRPSEIEPVARFQIALDVAHGVLFNGLVYGHPGMVLRGQERVEEIKKQVMEFVKTNPPR